MLHLVEDGLLPLHVLALVRSQDGLADLRLHVQLLEDAVHVARGARVLEAHEVAHHLAAVAGGCLPLVQVLTEVQPDRESRIIMSGFVMLAFWARNRGFDRGPGPQMAIKECVGVRED
jgi:hypothetical protein